MNPSDEFTLLSEADVEVLGPLDDAISPEVLAHARNPRNLGPLARPDGEAATTGICEDTVAIQVRLDGEVIEAAHFLTNGCGFTVACGSMVTELARGRSLNYALQIDGERIARALGGLPREHTHCADLAANAFRAAVKEALAHRHEPWKRAYRS